MNIVVYGCDNSGKTTLAEHIVKEFNFEYVRSKGGPKMDLIEVLKYLHDNLCRDDDKVFDRFTPIEEFANGIVLRHENKIASNFIDTSEFINAVDLFIYARPSMETVKNFGEREQMDGIIKNIDSLREMYDVYTLNKINGHRPLFIFDWTCDRDYQEIDTAIRYFINNQANINEICRS